MSLPSATSDVGTDEKPVVTERREDAPVEEESSLVEDSSSSSLEEVPVREEQRPKKIRPWRPGTHTLREIEKFRRPKFRPITPKAELLRMLREIMNVEGYGGIRWTKTAIEALHEARDSYAMDLFAASERKRDGLVTRLATSLT